MVEGRRGHPGAPARWGGVGVALCLLLFATACDFRLGVYPWQVRVPIENVNARFVIADLTWFEEEQTLFVFYQVDADQGLSDASEIELSFRTDEVEQPFIDLQSLPPVHEHLSVRCGERSLCGSYSTRVELMPRDVELQLRYHRDGELVLDAAEDVHIVAAGAPNNSRSAVLYGVFNEQNTHVQWRLRHQFPGIRNEHAQALGLRRELILDDVRYGTLEGAREIFLANSYGYGLSPACPDDFAAHDNSELSTFERAIFDENALPIESSTAAHACAAATVTDARGEFTTTAWARKNPQIREAFPALQTPIRENQPVSFFLEVCGDPRPELHRAMQMQRLSLSESDVVCIDDFATLDFPSRLATLLTERIDQRRALGADMVLVLALSRPNVRGVAQAVEAALGLLLPLENQTSSPHVSGAFVFDSVDYTIGSPEVARLTLWCPSSPLGPDLDAVGDTSLRSCALQTPFPLALGDFSLSSLPILPTETQFENFVEEYGPQQAGRVTDLSFRAPIRTATSTNVPVGDFGVATFFNEEAISAAPADAFSYCALADTGLVVFRVEGLAEVLPLSVLGEVHAVFPMPRYELGLFWDFPFLLQLNYESRLAAAVELPEEIPFIASFGLGTPAEEYLGGLQWTAEQFEVGAALSQCTRFCDHPTFGSSGVYNVGELFFESYPARCYRPVFPELGDGGFPTDP